MAEWIEDWYQEDYYATCLTDCNDPQGPNNDTGFKAVRGGSFQDPANHQKATTRNKADPTTSTKDIGLRCVGRAGTPKVD